MRFCTYFEWDFAKRLSERITLKREIVESAETNAEVSVHFTASSMILELKGALCIHFGTFIFSN
jgi:hypothetical protein